MFVKVAVENAKYSFDKPFAYKVPVELEKKVKLGIRVMVPFGTANKSNVALVLEIVKDELEGKFKEMVSVLDAKPVLTKEMIALVHWMKSRYFCTMFDCIRLMLPAGISYKIEPVYNFVKFPENQIEANRTELDVLTLLKNSSNPLSLAQIAKSLGLKEDEISLTNLVAKALIDCTDKAQRKMGDASQKMISPILNTGVKLTQRQEEVLSVLNDIGETTVKDLMYFTGCSMAIIKALIDKGVAKIFEQEVYRKPKSLETILDEKPKSVQLSICQSKALDNIVDDLELGEKPVSLLYGITGSGKTSVYLKLIDYVIGKGQDVILLLPEISLTPQSIELFKNKFPGMVGVFHSRLSLGERLDEWKRVEKGETKIVIGTRSAIFAPFKKLGLVVIDEEQEHTYKSEITPRYNAKEIARFRCSFNKAFCLLTSATPSIESFHMAENGIFGLNRLEIRYGDALLPSVRVVDMNQEEVFGNTSDLSFALRKGLNDVYRDGKQSIVLLNRRGYHTFARCKACKTVINCPNCSISLTLHSANNRLMCHYCSYSSPLATICPECGSKEMDFSGYGTQRAEDALMNAVPGARVLRVDADSTSAKYSLEKKLDAFASGEYDIMIGTQMVAKGLNFENVTLVGIMSADQSLFSDDFRSNERTFDLITQVIGRSGRGKYKGQAIIQTHMPENVYLRLAASQDYSLFYEMELDYRKAMLYPPFVDILLIVAVGEDEALVKKALEHFSQILSERIKKSEEKIPVRLLRPTPASVLKVNSKIRYKMILKCRNTVKFRDLISAVLITFQKNREYKDVTIYADPNPYSIM